MSLINDALKQAKQAQDSSPSVTTPGLDFRAPSRAQLQSRPGRGLAAPVLIASIAVVVVFAIWKFYPAGGHPAPVVATAPPPTVAASLPAVAVASGSAAAPAVSPVALSTRANHAATAPDIKQPETATTINLSAITPIVPDLEPDTLPNVIVVKPDSASGLRSAIAPAVSAPPKPTVPKLQGIVYSPTRPSAMISGRTLFIGDKFGDQKVARIEADSVTLVSATRTNVMSLTP
jgi:hypothetical protein